MINQRFEKLAPKTRKSVLVRADTSADARKRALRENPGWTIARVGAPRKQYNIELRKKK